MCLFVLLTQEGWVEVVQDTLVAVGDNLAPFVAVLFVVYHMFMYGVSTLLTMFPILWKFPLKQVEISVPPMEFSTRNSCVP